MTEPPTLAAKLGMTTHLSPLLRKAQRLGLDADGLERLAISRGCDYYGPGDPQPAPPVTRGRFSDTELAMALLNPALRYHPQTLRLGAAMVSAEGNHPDDLAHLAKLERCESLLRYIAECGHKFEPQNPFWADLLGRLPPTPSPRSDVVPHPTRFVAMTGVTRRGAETVVQWIRPSRPATAHG